MNKQVFVDLDNAREEDQRQVMQKIIEEGHCPFCPENLALYHKQENIFEGKFWLVTKNQWPYENTLFHYLAILKRHAEHLSELTHDEGAELVELMGRLEKKLDAKGGAFAMRFGDTAHSAGTVLHLHTQFIVPDIDKSDFKPVRFKIGKDK
jgi:diadenosine tetraphosphate (Ap4A) HIT family hydrolase